jgi:hypothetical protein
MSYNKKALRVKILLAAIYRWEISDSRQPRDRRVLAYHRYCHLQTANFFLDLPNITHP